MINLQVMFFQYLFAEKMLFFLDQEKNIIESYCIFIAKPNDNFHFNSIAKIIYILDFFSGVRRVKGLASLPAET